MKITEKQLELLKQKRSAVHQLQLYIGDIEGQKHVLLHNLASANEDLEKLKQELEDQYGKVNIDINTGEYEPLK